MAIPSPTGYLDDATGYIIPENTGTWADLSGATWATWTSWCNEPASPMLWVTDTIVLPFSAPYSLRIIADANGQVEYDIYTSTTGEFEGEETLTEVRTDDTGIPSFQGQYLKVVARVTRTSGVNVLRNLDIRALDFVLEYKLSDIDTSTLAGSAGARELSLPTPVSGIVNMTATVKVVDAYTPNVYVTDISTTQFATAIVVDKDAASPKIGIFGIDGYARDGIVDVVVRALPNQKMLGNNLISG